MNIAATNDYEIFQSYNELQESGPLLSQSQSLVEQAKSKMPDQQVETYIESETGQRDILSSDFMGSKAKNISNEDINVTPVYFLDPKPNWGRSISLQKWQGIITEVNIDSFKTDLINLTQEGLDEETEISFAEISDEDKILIKIGAVFYWTIGYHQSHSGQRTRISHIRFRRLPAWSKEEIQKSKTEAKITRDKIGWK